jgi:hypothetical protein
MPDLPSEELLRGSLHLLPVDLCAEDVLPGLDLRAEDLLPVDLRPEDLLDLLRLDLLPEDLQAEALPQGPDLPSQELLRGSLDLLPVDLCAEDVLPGLDLRAEDLLDLLRLDLLPEASPSSVPHVLHLLSLHLLPQHVRPEDLRSVWPDGSADEGPAGRSSPGSRPEDDLVSRSERSTVPADRYTYERNQAGSATCGSGFFLRTDLACSQPRTTRSPPIFPTSPPNASPPLNSAK